MSIAQVRSYSEIKLQISRKICLLYNYKTITKSRKIIKYENNDITFIHVEHND